MALSFEEFNPNNPKAKAPATAPSIPVSVPNTHKSGALDFSEFMPDKSMPQAKPKSGILDFSEFLPTSANKPTIATPTLHQDKPISLEEAKAGLSWSAPAVETIIRRPRRTDVDAPASMQPTAADIIALQSAVSPKEMEQARAALSPTVTKRSDLALLKGKAEELGTTIGEAVGYPKTGKFIGGVVEDI